MPDFPSVLPPNASKLLRDIEQAVAGFIAELPVAAIKNVHNPRLCRADFLPWLAWEWSVDDWDSGWSESAKRETVWSAPSVHRAKGTVGAIKVKLASAGYGDAEIIERYGWEVHNGATRHDGSITYDLPDHWAEYRIKLKRPITIEQANQVRAMLATTTPARSKLKALDFTEAFNAHNGRIQYDGQFTHGVA